MTEPLELWIAELSTALGVAATAVPQDLLLDVARDAAHGIARPAAPLTTFLVGLAAGTRGGSLAEVQAAAAIATALATGDSHDLATGDSAD